jgi:hypothetical protein
MLLLKNETYLQKYISLALMSSEILQIKIKEISVSAS